MDKLLRGIQSQTIDLCTLDLMTSLMNIQFYFYYGNDGTGSKFMPTELLRESFHTTLLDFPALVGRLEVDGSERAKIVVDKNNLNLPEFLVSQSSVHFRDFQASKFSWDALPDGVATVGPVTSANSSGDIKAANVHVVRLRDNSGVILFVSVAHYVFDGAGYCEFLNRWAELCRWMYSDNAMSEPPTCYCTYERSSMFDKFPKDRKALDEPTMEMITATGSLARWLAWVSPSTRARLLGATLSLKSMAGHIFHIPTGTLAWLRASVREHLSSDERISDNDIITALLTMTVAQSVAKCQRDSASASYLSSLSSYLFLSTYTPVTSFYTQVVIDARPRLSGLSAARYTGNSSVSRCLVSSMESMTSGSNEQSLALIAKSVRQLVTSVDAQYIGQFHDMIHKDTTCFMGPLIFGMARKPFKLSNLSRLTMYHANFGNGIPAWMTPVRTIFPNSSFILPAHPSTDGCFIYMSMTEQSMATILQNKFWMNIADVVY
ncbi:hypothetical protein H4S07_002200 [Coemansia furcata]|uniref:Uncharacterized protein n=1 Tax=Coemansia furcata TaxID=417177 RepID=A0ACC1LLI8_9FUNG|nr:hypothetical protein H4S07_002200 [Coemansia furcata]